MLWIESLEIFYHGIVDGDKKRELLKTCDIFVLLTRYPNEGQPISILEAMGNGMMIVTTDHAGISDIVQNGVNGVVASNSVNTAELMDKMQNPSINMVQTAYRQIFIEHTESRYIRNMEKIFESV